MVRSKMLRLAVATVSVAAGVLALAGPAHADEHGMHGHAAASAAAAELPPLRIVSPHAGETVGRVVSVDFETTADLSKLTMGASALGAHLHLELDGAVTMPAYSDLKPVGNGRYRYTFDLPAEPGPRTVKIYWADARHGTIEPSVQSVRVTVSGDQRRTQP